MMTDGTPEDPVTDLALAAASAHEMFLTLQAAGFTENQALYLTGQMLGAARPC